MEANAQILENIHSLNDLFLKSESLAFGMLMLKDDNFCFADIHGQPSVSTELGKDT